MACRSNWPGGNRPLPLRWVTQVQNSITNQQANFAYGNWNSADGPQDFLTTPRSNDSFIYFKLDSTIVPPSGYTWNCTGVGSCPAPNPNNTVWSEIYVTDANRTCTGCSAMLARAVIAHEIGHTLQLFHHNDAGALMQEGTTRVAPTSVDIGSDPPCTGTSGQRGIRCVFNFTSINPSTPNSFGASFYMDANQYKVAFCISPVSGATFYQHYDFEAYGNDVDVRNVLPNTSCYGSVLATYTLAGGAHHFSVAACNNLGCSQFRDLPNSYYWQVPCSSSSGCPAGGTAAPGSHNHAVP